MPPQPALLPKTGRVKRHAREDEDHQLAPGPKPEAQRHGTAAITVDLDKCIQCGRCVTMCQDVQNMYVLGWLGRGKERHVGTVMDLELAGSRWGLVLELSRVKGSVACACACRLVLCIAGRVV